MFFRVLALHGESHGHCVELLAGHGGHGDGGIEHEDQVGG